MRLSEKWTALSVSERKAAVIEELKRLSEKGKAVSANRWDGQKQDWMPSAGYIAQKLIRWAQANEEAGLKYKRRRGSLCDRQMAQVVKNADMRRVLDECKNPLVVRAGSEGQPYRYYNTTLHCWQDSTVYGGGHFGHAKA